MGKRSDGTDFTSAQLVLRNKGLHPISVDGAQLYFTCIAGIDVSQVPSQAGAAACSDQVQDWARLCAYADLNREIGDPRPDEMRVVFMGDSITEFWDRERQGMFSARSHINRGISGQTTSQMLLRFRQDVVALKPRAVVLLAGTNDIAGNTGPVDMATVFGNIASMAELATQHGIGVLIVSVLPASKYYWAPEKRPGPQITALNALLREYAMKCDYKYVDLHAQGLAPRTYDPLVDVTPPDEVAKLVRNVQETIRKCVEVMPTHAEYIARHCAAGTAPGIK